MILGVDRMNFRVPYKLYEIIERIKNEYIKKGMNYFYNSQSFCIYSSPDTINNIKLESICYLDDYAEIDDDTDEETYSTFVIENNLELLFTDELLQDVISSAIDKKSDISNEDILKAICYYEEYDTFINL